MDKYIGRVTSVECEEIRSINNHKKSIEELKIIVPENSMLYNEVVNDLNTTNEKYNIWWNSMSKKYGWNVSNNKRFQIDFKTCQIRLVDKNNE